MNLNKVIFAGRLAREPATKNFEGGSSICEFTVCSNRSYFNRAKEKVNDPCYLDCVAYAEKGQQIQTHFKKGKAICIEGRLKYESFETRDGAKRSKIVLVVENWHFVGAPATGQALAPEDESMAMPRREEQSKGGGSKPATPGDEVPFTEEEIPFAHNLPERWI